MSLYSKSWLNIMSHCAESYSNIIQRFVLVVYITAVHQGLSIDWCSVPRVPLHTEQWWQMTIFSPENQVFMRNQSILIISFLLWSHLWFFFLVNKYLWLFIKQCVSDKLTCYLYAISGYFLSLIVWEIEESLLVYLRLKWRAFHASLSIVVQMS